MRKPGVKTAASDLEESTRFSRRTILGRTAAATAGLLLASSRAASATTASPAPTGPSRAVVTALAGARVRVGTNLYAPQALLALMVRSPGETAQLLSKGVRLESTPAAIGYVQGLTSPAWLSDGGEVTTSAAMGALVGIILAVASLAGLKSCEGASGETETEDQGSGGSDVPTGDNGDTGGSGDGGGGGGGDSGGSGNGGGSGG